LRPGQRQTEIAASAPTGTAAIQQPLKSLSLFSGQRLGRPNGGP
jgi:hypothetical protein